MNSDATKLEYTDLDGKNRAVAITATGGGVLYDVTVFQVRSHCSLIVIPVA